MRSVWAAGGLGVIALASMTWLTPSGNMSEVSTVLSVVALAMPLQAALREFLFGHTSSRVQEERRSSAAWRATSWAAKMAGGRRNMLEAWRDVLEGDPDNGIVLSRRQQRRYAAGFVLAALKMRLHDLVAPLWHPVDWLLSKDSRTNGFIATVVGAQAIYIVDDGGIPALVTEVWEPCGILGAGLYVLARWLRRVRGIELAISPTSEE